MIMRDTVVKVDLGAIRENMRLIAGSCGSDVEMCIRDSSAPAPPFAEP